MSIEIWDWGLGYIYLWDILIAWWWWENPPFTPWANTVAYYPFTSDILDHSSNSNNFSWWTYTFSNNKITITSSLTWPVLVPVNTSWDRTIHMWTTWWNTSARCLFRFSAASNWDTLWHLKWTDEENWNRPWASYWRSSWYRNRPSSVSVWSFFLMTWVKDWTSMKLYLNWELVSTTTLWSNIWNNATVKSILENWTYWEIIVEDKVWTVDEIQTYYNKSKSNYWL